MTYNSSGSLPPKPGEGDDSLSSDQKYLVSVAVWDADIQRYVVEIRCGRCNRIFTELLTIALSVAGGETQARCISCDDAALVRLEVIKIVIFG